MDVLVPFAADEPKTRLDPVLGPDERAAFARAMLLDVCDALEATGREPTVLATASIEAPHPVAVDERPLTEAVDAHVDRLGERPLVDRNRVWHLDGRDRKSVV